MANHSSDILTLSDVLEGWQNYTHSLTNKISKKHKMDLGQSKWCTSTHILYHIHPSIQYIYPLLPLQVAGSYIN